MDWIESFLFANHYAHWTKKHCLIFAVFQTPLKNNTDVIISNSQLPHFGIAKKLTNEEFLSKARLVGGTALALQYGHRISIDLDFFGNIEEDNETIKEVLINIGKLSVIKESKNIKIYILDDIKIDFVNYRYNWLDPAIEENGIRLASPRDIAAMKINAIEGRGTKKDFIDIYFLLQHYSLETF